MPLGLRRSATPQRGVSKCLIGNILGIPAVSGTPHRPNPPQRRVELDCMSLMASAAEGTTLLISCRRAVDANVRANSMDCWRQCVRKYRRAVGVWKYLCAIPCEGSGRSVQSKRHIGGRRDKIGI